MTPDALMVSSTALATDLQSLSDRLIPLLRSQPGDLDAYLETVACNVAISATKTNAHCYFLALDGNKRPRVNDFVRFIAAKITDFAIPRSEIYRALDEAHRLRSTSPVDRLNTRARNLFTTLPKSGEGGEVLLSILTEHFLKLPQMFTKMVTKTNQEMHIHGSDGIHAGVDVIDGTLALYWGESKLYQDAASGIRDCFASLAPFLLDCGGSASTQERDLQLMRDGLNLDDHGLEEALKHFLDPNDSRFKQLVYRGVCLVGFDSDAYPKEPNSKEALRLKAEIETTFEQCKSQIANRVTTEKIHTFDIEMFCLPFPNVEDFRLAFRRELRLSHEQG